MRTTRLSQPAAGRGSCRRAAGLFARGLAVHEAPGILLRSGCARASGTASVVKEREAGGLGALPAQTGSRETAHVALKIAHRPADLFDSNPCVRRFWWPPSRRNEAGPEHGAPSGAPTNTRTRQLIAVARAIVTCGPAPTRAGTAPKRRRRATAAVDSFSPLSDGGAAFSGENDRNRSPARSCYVSRL